MARAASTEKKAEADAKSVGVNARFTIAQTVKIDAAWQAQGFRNRSTFLRHAALVAAGEPSATPAMLQAMTDVRMELAAIGRNINQAAREMNRRRKVGIAVDPAMLFRVEDLDALRTQIQEAVVILRSVLLKAPKKRKSRQ